MNFSSQSLPPAQRAARYEAALRDYFSSFDMSIQVDFETVAPESFTASLELVTIGTLTGAIHYSNSSHSLHAEPAKRGVLGLDLYLVRAGGICFTNPRGTIDLAAGDMALLRSDTEFRSHSGGFEMIALGLPDTVVRDRVLQNNWALGRRIPGSSGFAACLASLLGTAAARHRDLTPAEGTVVQMAVSDSLLLLGSSGTDATDNARTGLSAQQRAKLDHLKALALRHLQVADLTPHVLAREADISLRTLHRLFNASGQTFRSWLRDCRLERCRLEIAEPGRGRNTIASVAFRWGFNDLRTFNRAFSARYGTTPQSVRDAGRTGTQATESRGEGRPQL